MQTHDLTVFLHLSETLHFGQTGESLHMSASAVSRLIKRMEDEIGQRLLERDNRSVRLTDAGRQFQTYARQSLNEWQRFQQSINQADQPLTGEVSVFCSVTAAYSILSDTLESFRQRHPDIDIKLHTGDQADAIPRLLNGDEDIAITARPDKLSNRLNFSTLTHSPLLFIYPSAVCATRTLISDYLESGYIDLSSLPFIVSERGQARVQIDRWFKAKNTKPNIYAQVSGHEAIVSMVGLGFGIGVVPELVLINSPLKDKVQVFDIQPPLTPFAVGLCSLKQRMENPLVRAFWDCAKSAYQVDF